MTFTSKEKKLINRELDRSPPLITKKFKTIKRKKTGRYVEVFKNRKTGKLEEQPVNTRLLKFKLRVARSR